MSWITRSRGLARLDEYSPLPSCAPHRIGILLDATLLSGSSAVLAPRPGNRFGAASEAPGAPSSPGGEQERTRLTPLVT